MGISLFSRCSTNYSRHEPAPAPNPSPDRWTLLEKVEYTNGYVLRVRYHDCTNFEGVKVMVYRGKYTPRQSLDPHFHPGDDAPVARFRPDADGWKNACALAQSMNPLNNNLTTTQLGVCSADLLNVLQNVQSANLTADKTIKIIRDGFKISGFTLVDPETGNRAIVEMSAVRWLSKDESWWLMHESKSPLSI